MESIFPVTPSGYTIYCDDVRHEISGKRTFVGIYHAELLVLEFPTILPVFHAVITFSLRPDDIQQLNGPIIFKLILETNSDSQSDATEEVLGTVEMELESRPTEHSEQIQKADKKEEQDIIIASSIVIRQSPLKLTGPGLIKVRAYNNDKEWRLGGLRIKHLDKAPAPQI